MKIKFFSVLLLAIIAMVVFPISLQGADKFANHPACVAYEKERQEILNKTVSIKAQIDEMIKKLIAEKKVRLEDPLFLKIVDAQVTVNNEINWLKISTANYIVSDHKITEEYILIYELAKRAQYMKDDLENSQEELEKAKKAYQALQKQGK